MREHFKADIKVLAPFDIGDRLLTLDDHLYLKGFLEEALCAAIIRGHGPESGLTVIFVAGFRGGSWDPILRLCVWS